MKIYFITPSDTCYGGIKISPKGVGKHPQGGIEGISKTLGNHLQDPWRWYLHPMEPAPSTHGAAIFDPRKRHLRRQEVPPS